MNDKKRRQKQADALLCGAPKNAGRACDVSSVGKLLTLERRGNKYFGGDESAGDIESMTEVLFVATRTRVEMRGLGRLSGDEWRDMVEEFADEITMEDVNAFGQYFESALGEINASSAEVEPDPKASPGKP